MFILFKLLALRNLIIEALKFKRKNIKYILIVIIVNKVKHI